MSHPARGNARSVLVLAAVPLWLGIAAAAQAQTPGLTPTPTPSLTPTPPNVQENVVVSAARGPEIETEIPGQATVISGDELRRRNSRTVAEALQDILGVDTGEGSDNGGRLPNIGMWGLKEFDALLVMVDGVPAGGPFNPSLSQINVEDVDRIEIVKGPQGTLYGVSAFAGMIQVFTRSASQGTQLSLSGGSFSEGRLAGSTNIPVGKFTLRLFGNIDRAQGWQDHTDYKDDRGGFRLDGPISQTGTMSVIFDMYRNTQFFGSPLPVDPPSGETIPGFQSDRNYEVGGARLDHRVYSAVTRITQPLSSTLTLENVLSFTRDNQISIQSFIDSVDGNNATASGLYLRPEETDVYEDFHLIAHFSAAGQHRLVAGTALTWGRTTADGNGFDIDLQIDPVVVPDFANTPPGDVRSFNDRRTFLGLYADDEWTPVPFLTLTGGARFDHVSETLQAQVQEIGSDAPDVSDDERTDGQWSGGIAALVRVVTDRPGVLNEANFYVAAKSAFKPAAPNLTEGEDAHILEPERTRSGEIGIKTRWWDRQISFDLSFFHMMFENLVVSILGPDGNPELTNAGEERFQGMETQIGYHPQSLPDFSFFAGYAHHDARYVHFSFIDPDAGLQVADGQRLELTPRDLWNVKALYLPASGFGAWAAARHQSHRPFDKINIAYMPSFYEWDLGVGCSFGNAMLSVVGRNLSDSRHYVAESEIGDGQLYVAPPRRFMANLSWKF